MNGPTDWTGTHWVTSLDNIKALYGISFHHFSFFLPVCDEMSVNKNLRQYGTYGMVQDICESDNNIKSTRKTEKRRKDGRKGSSAEAQQKHKWRKAKNENEKSFLIMWCFRCHHHPALNQSILLLILLRDHTSCSICTINAVRRPFQYKIFWSCWCCFFRRRPTFVWLTIRFTDFSLVLLFFPHFRTKTLLTQTEGPTLLGKESGDSLNAALD